MIKSVNYTDIIKAVGNEIIKQANIQRARFANADSVRGADLKKILSEVNVQSIDLQDVFITFELLEKDNEDNTIINEDNNTISVFACYSFMLHVYGNMSSQMSQMIRARMRLPEVATSLKQKGIFISGVENVGNAKEFINNTLWPRCDISLEIKVRYNFKNLQDIEYFNSNVKNIKLNIKKI